MLDEYDHVISPRQSAIWAERREEERTSDDVPAEDQILIAAEDLNGGKSI